MNETAIRDLAAAVTLQAVKDFFALDVTPQERKVILKDLRSSWMQNFTNGTSANVAEQLEKRPDEIEARLNKHKEEL